MPTTESQTLLDRLAEVRAKAQEFFAQASLETDLSAKDWRSGKRPGLSEDSRSKAEAIVVDLLALANEASVAVRRSPILSEADIRQVEHAIKGMRAALRLKAYEHWDSEVLHDEDGVVALRPAGQSEEPKTSGKASRSAFDRWAEQFRGVVELVGAGVEHARVNIAGSGLTAPAGYRPGTAFIMMSLQSGYPELEDILDTVKRCFAKFGVTAVAANDIEHEDVITKRILDEIRTAEFLYADLTQERPSVYYEVGYAHALGRRVILFRKSGTPIHFDLAAYNCPDYANNRQLEERLTRRLTSVTGQQPSGESPAPATARPVPEETGDSFA